MSFSRTLSWGSLVLATAAAAPAAGYRPSAILPPQPIREFRGLWIATVANIDWPSRPGLSTADQKQELLRILDRAARLRLNAVIFQVRPACDAIYDSPIEPWSEYLTGTMGRAPSPYYDPLAFAVAEAHRRGLELHAWFNPYRARHFSGKSPLAANHVIRAHPGLVRRVGRYFWLDPGEPAVRDYSLSVVMDVVKRYDIDGVHFDDYFYPDNADEGADASFPDEASWRKYGAGRGLSRDDWRRQNVNLFIKRVYDSIKAVKPWVKFGVSPHGIWRPGHPASIRGMDAYARIYADSRKWFASGWVDYFAPQLYWPIESKEQSFPALLGWWEQQNARGRHLWPGLNVARADRWKPDEIPDQIRLTRSQRGVTGYVLYNTSSLLGNGPLTTALEHRINDKPALVPASPWLGSGRPGKPNLVVTAEHLSRSRARWEAAAGTVVRWWLLQSRTAGVWTTEILPAGRTSYHFDGELPEVVALRAVDRIAALSPAAVVASTAGQLPAPEGRPTETRRQHRKILSPKGGER